MTHPDKIAVVGDTHGNMAWTVDDVIPHAVKHGVSTIVQGKPCSKCGETKPLSGFHRDKTRRDGYKDQCKLCRIARQQEYYRKNGDRIKAERRASYAADSSKAKESVNVFRKANKVKVKAWKRRHYQANRDAILARVSQHYRENTERVRATRAASEAKKPELYKALARAYAARRRAQLRSAVVVKFTVAELGQRVDYYGGKCWMCGAEATCMDHVKPLAAGGSHMLSNLRPACTSCNCSKAATWPFAPNVDVCEVRSLDCDNAPHRVAIEIVQFKQSQEATP